MITHSKQNHTCPPQQANAPQEAAALLHRPPPISSDEDSSGLLDPCTLARIVAPIPAFLAAGANPPPYDQTLLKCDFDPFQVPNMIRLCYHLDSAFFGGADTPLDEGVVALLRANRRGVTCRRAYPLNVTIEFRLNPRYNYRCDRVWSALVFSVYQEANLEVCRGHAHWLLAYLINPTNIRRLWPLERAMLGRTPVPDTM